MHHEQIFIKNKRNVGKENWIHQLISVSFTKKSEERVATSTHSLKLNCCAETQTFFTHDLQQRLELGASTSQENVISIGL